MVNGVRLSEKIYQQREQFEAMLNGGLADFISKTYPAVERSKELSFDEFKTKFRDQNRPVIFEGLLNNWKALKEWNFEYFKKTCGNAKIMVNHYDKTRSFPTTIADFVDKLNSGEYDENSNPVYLQEWQALRDNPALRNDTQKLAILEYDFRPKLYGASTFTAWLGQKNSVTILHKDTLSVDLVMAQIYGRKHWTLIAPDAEMSELADGSLDLNGFVKSPNTVLTHCILGPGDLLYLPAHWYHRVKLLDNSISLGLHAIDERNLRLHIFERFQELIPMAVNGEYVKSHHPDFYQISFQRYVNIARELGIDITKMRKVG